MTTDVKVPDIGDFKDVPVVTILVSVGDTIAKEDALIELESDKATLEVPSPAAGVIKEIKVSEGDKVSEGSLIMVIEESGSGDAPAKEEKKEEPTAEAPKAEAPKTEAASAPVMDAG
ncbi:MAG: biotin/lipoyl-containing protein, partial [Rhodobacterales bacterium]